MSEALITFAIPYYRNPDLLARAIDSVCQQDRPDWRLLVADDSGGDPSIRELVESRRDPRMSYVRNETRLGMVGNWNRCLDLAQTEFITLLHADDELLPNYASHVLRGLQAHPTAVLCFCNARIIDESGQSVFSFPDWFKRWLTPVRYKDTVYHGESALIALLRGNFIMCPTMCYRFERLGRRRFDPQWVQVPDLDMTTRLLLDGESLLGLHEVGYLYRRHAGNTTIENTESLLRFDEEHRLYTRLEAAAKGLRWTKAVATARARTIIKLNLTYWAIRDAGRGRLRAVAQKAEMFRRLYNTGSS